MCQQSHTHLLITWAGSLMLEYLICSKSGVNLYLCWQESQWMPLQMVNNYACLYQCFAVHPVLLVQLLSPDDGLKSFW